MPDGPNTEYETFEAQHEPIMPNVSRCNIFRVGQFHVGIALAM